MLRKEGTAAQSFQKNDGRELGGYLKLKCRSNGSKQVWDFKGRELKFRWEIEVPLIKMVYHPGNGLLATVADDMVLRLFDVTAVRLVRIFVGHMDRVTDLCFSEDGKWLLSSSMDGTIRVWDVISSRQLDAMQMDSAVTALSLSPGMDMLATTHVGHNGIYLWANRMIYSKATDIEPFISGKQVVKVSLPTVSSKRESEEGDEKSIIVAESNVNKPDVSGSLIGDSYSAQLTPELVTLALLPKAQWQSLVNLDVIKMRNKPIEPPKKPEKAPFFLPSLPTLSGERIFIPSSTNGDGDQDETRNDKTVFEARGKKLGGESLSFMQLLQSCAKIKDFTTFTNYLKGLSPSAVDMELRLLQIVDNENITETEHSVELQGIGMLLDYFVHEVSCNNNFEFVQALIRLFLKIHGETIRCQVSLQEKARKLLEIQSSTWQRLDTSFQNARCMITYLSSSQF